MGKLSMIVVLLLMMNTVGFLVLAAHAEEKAAEGVLVDNPYNSTVLPLLRFYSVEAGQSASIDQNGTLYQSIPTQASDDILSGFLDFVDRILSIFPFIRGIIEFMLVPSTIFTIMGLPWQIASLLAVAFTILIVFGLIDLFTGGNS